MSDYNTNAYHRFKLFKEGNASSKAEREQTTLAPEGVGKDIVQEGRAEINKFVSALDKFLALNRNKEENKKAQTLLSETSRNIGDIMTKGPEFKAEQLEQASAADKSPESHSIESQETNSSFSHP